jgi:hypothetical protein
MMDVMKTYVSSEPLEHFGKFVIGTTFKRGVHPIPIVLTRPIHAFKIVLDIEQPESQQSSEKSDGELYKDECAESNCIAEKQHNRQNYDVGDIDVISLALCLIPYGKPLGDEKNEDGTDNECDDGIPRKSINPSFPFWG